MNPKAVLVTGCSSGIGRAVALRLAARGDLAVYATARRRETLAELERPAVPGGQACRTLSLDVNDEASMAAAVAEIERAHGAVWALVNNAGYSQPGAIENVPLARVRAVFETNVFGLSRLTQLVLPGMRRAGDGRIVNLSSMGGRFTFPGGGYYHATKHAIEAISDALRFEVSGFGVKVVVVQPGLIRSGFAEAAVGGMGPPPEGPYAAFEAAVARSTKEAYEKGPLAKLGGEPDDVAKVIERALTAARPKPRYTVTGSATLLLGLRRLLSDRMWDAFLRPTFPTPGR